MVSGGWVLNCKYNANRSLLLLALRVMNAGLHPGQKMAGWWQVVTLPPHYWKLSLTNVEVKQLGSKIQAITSLLIFPSKTNGKVRKRRIYHFCSHLGG